MPKFAKANRQYGGPGVFVPPEGSPSHVQHGSGSSSDDHRRDSFSSSYLPSNSSMGLDLYKPDYEQTVRGHTQQSASTEQLVNDMGELTVLDPRRRDTFPVRIHFVYLCSPALGLSYGTQPMPSSFSTRSVSTSGHSATSSSSSLPFPVSEGSVHDTSPSSFAHRAVTPAGQRPHRYSLASSQSHEISQYQPAYEPAPPPRGPHIIHPLVTVHDTACPPHLLDLCQFHRRLNHHHVRRVPWPLMDRNRQSWHHLQQMQTSLYPDILPPQVTHLLRRASRRVHPSLQLPHPPLHQPPPVLFCQQILRNDLNLCIFHKQDTTLQFRHHHRHIFLHRLYQRFRPLRNQYHLWSNQVSPSQFPANHTNTFLLQLLYHRLGAVQYPTTFQGRGHCLPNPSRQDNWFRPLLRYL